MSSTVKEKDSNCVILRVPIYLTRKLRTTFNTVEVVRVAAVVYDRYSQSVCMPPLYSKMAPDIAYMS